MPAILSVIIPCNGEDLPVVDTLSPLVSGAASGVISEVLLVDRASSDVIARVADVAGCGYIAFSGSQSAAMAVGAARARARWLMFLHAGTVLDTGWGDEVAGFIERTSNYGKPRAAIFRPAPSPYAEPGLRETMKKLLRAISKPSPDQGLLIARDHYAKIGGHTDGSRAEARLFNKLGKGLTLLRSRIVIP